MHLLLNIIKVLLAEANGKREIGVNQEELMENVITFFNSNYLPSDCKKEVLIVLADVISNPVISR